MEARRLAILCSHLRQIDSGGSSLPKRPVSNMFSVVSKWNCVATTSDDHDRNQDGKESADKGCIFCKIIRGESPAFKIYEDDVCLCILDINPLTHGKIWRSSENFHFMTMKQKIAWEFTESLKFSNRVKEVFRHSLIIPKHHFSSLKATPPSVVASMCSKVPFVSNAIMKATSCDSFNLLVNTGEAAGQVIFHTHLHIIPRKARDRLWTSKSFRRQTLKENHETAQLADRIKKQLTFPKKNCEDGKD